MKNGESGVGRGMGGIGVFRVYMKTFSEIAVVPYILVHKGRPMSVIDLLTDNKLSTICVFKF